MTDEPKPELALSLPEGWCAVDAAPAAGPGDRLQLEILGEHLLSDVALEAVARRMSNDDGLYRHVSDPARFSLVHLTWGSRRESTPHFPSVEFDPTFVEFLQQERRLDDERKS
jgi:hypothetical protein